MDRIIHNHVSSTYVPDWGNTGEFIAVHYLGCVGENYELAQDGTGAHFTVFYDGSIHQRCALNAVPWAVGTGGYYTQKHPRANNYNTISIELCVKKTVNKGAGNLPEDTDWYFTEETQEAAVWLVQKLMRERNIPAENVLRHFDIVNKWCPAPYCSDLKYKTSWSWSEFKAKLSGSENTEEPSTTASEASEASEYDKVWMGWTVRETGSAGLRCIHGDSGKAYGLQFDYRYGLVPFMEYCVSFNQSRYKGFEQYIKLGAWNSALIYNEGLGQLWQNYYDAYTEEFQQLQYTCAYQQYYLPAKKYIQNNYGINLDEHSPALRGSVWSMAFRSGAETGAKKYSGCTSEMQDEDILVKAYRTYGSEDSGRWTQSGQLGDALKALANWDYENVHKDMSTIEVKEEEAVPASEAKKQYYVQAGFFYSESFAKAQESRVKSLGFDCIVKQREGGYFCQCGLFDLKENADKLCRQLKAKMINAITKEK